MYWSIPLVAIFTFLYAVSLIRARKNADVPGRLFYLQNFFSLLAIGIAFFCLWTGTGLPMVLECTMMVLIFTIAVNYFLLFVFFVMERRSKPALYIVSSAGILATFIALIILNF